MSITTKRGDSGETDLLYGRRIAKTHPRMEALGAVDELTAALGLARLSSRDPNGLSLIGSVQQELVSLMGLLACHADDYARYLKDGFATLEQTHVTRLTAAAGEIEAALPPPTDWVLPGSRGSWASAHLDVARSICRRAERCVAGLGGADAPPTPHLVPYLNRLSDLLWLMARREECGP